MGKSSNLLAVGLAVVSLVAVLAIATSGVLLVRLVAADRQIGELRAAKEALTAEAKAGRTVAEKIQLELTTQTAKLVEAERRLKLATEIIDDTKTIEANKKIIAQEQQKIDAAKIEFGLMTPEEREFAKAIAKKAGDGIPLTEDEKQFLKNHPDYAKLFPK